jgi:hypothetical protein
MEHAPRQVQRITPSRGRPSVTLCVATRGQGAGNTTSYGGSIAAPTELGSLPVGELYVSHPEAHRGLGNAEHAGELLN